MQKIKTPFATTALLLLLLMLLFFSCEKGVERKVEKKAFRLSQTTWYRIAPKAPSPIVVNGTTYISAALYPGGGTGTATDIGNCNIYFNQQTYSTSVLAPPLGSVGAPVAAIPYYPVLGGPLPLIQPGDFTPLASLTQSLQIPTQVGGKVVNTVIYNNTGDAIFLAAISGAGSTYPISKILTGFDGKAWIVGGRGAYQHAAGVVDYNGYFNIINANDAAFNAEGWITY